MKTNAYTPQFFVKLLVFFGFISVLFSCSKEDTFSTKREDSNYTLSIPKGFPEAPIINNIELSSNKIALGEALFNDPIVSSDSTVSCATCHKQQFAFADNKPVSFGVNGKKGFRNSPSLTNVVYNKTFFHDGGIFSLDLVFEGPVMDSLEMNNSYPYLMDKLNASPKYQKMFQEVYGKGATPKNFTDAMLAFHYTFISGNSKYDKFHFQGDSSALNASEIRGMSLFNSDKTNCSKCHSDFNFTNEGFYNIGQYEVYPDPGRYRISINPLDKGKFRVPSLRNVEYTAPYMHDGNVQTLEEVVEHFNSGGKVHQNKSELIKPLNLTAQEKTDLVNFLKALSDEEFVGK